MDNRLILITNPGSSSRKYALYRGSELLCSLHFEFEGQGIVCTVKKSSGEKKKIETNFGGLTDVVENLQGILENEGYLDAETKLDAILARTAAPGEYFSQDHLVDEEALKQLEIGKKTAPLHIPVVAGEIEHFVKCYEGTPIVAISDSSFHNDRPDLARYYAFDIELADQYGIKRWGYHGLSVGSIVNYMKKEEILPEKLIVCHIGSGSSLTAVLNGKSLDTTIGYSPLEGLMMSTRVGNIDVAAAMAIKRNVGLENDEELEKYLNKKCGLLGVSAASDDMREVMRLRDQGDTRNAFALDLYMYRIRAGIGQMAAALGGVDAIVFTATIGERSDEMREAVVDKLAYLGFKLDEKKNISEMPNRATNLAAEGSKPIYVIRTDEMEEMIRRASLILDQKKG